MGLISAVLGRVPVLVWAVLAALAWGAWQRHVATTAQLELRQRDAKVANARIEGLLAQVAERDRILKEQGDAAARAIKARDEARIDADGAADAVGRLQLAARRAAARACAPAATASGDGEAGPGGPDVLADVLGRLAAAGGERAEALDAARIAGIECAARYDTLSTLPR